MGAGKKQALRVTFDSRLKLEFHGSKVTSDAGLLAYRELDEALGLTDLGDESAERLAHRQEHATLDGGVFSSGRKRAWEDKRHRNAPSPREKPRADW